MTDLERYAKSFDAEAGYLDWAAFGPVSQRVCAQGHRDLELLASGRRSDIDAAASHASEARRHLALLLNASVDDIVLQPSTTQGLMHAIYGLTGGLLLSAGEFPSLTIAASRAERTHSASVQLHWMRPESGFVTPAAISAALTEDIVAVGLSLVDFRTGYLADLPAIRDAIGDRLLIVDAVQGFGVVDVDYTVADVVCGNGYKWLRAGRGTGWARYNARAIERIAPVLSGFTGVDGGLPVDTVPEPSLSARAFTTSGEDWLAAARLAAALGEIREAGVPQIARALASRTETVMSYADRYGLAVITPRDPARRAGIVAIRPLGSELASLTAALALHGLTFTARSGAVRLSPHVGTGEDTMQLLDKALAEFRSVRERLPREAAPAGGV